MPSATRAAAHRGLHVQVSVGGRGSRGGGGPRQAWRGRVEGRGCFPSCPAPTSVSHCQAVLSAGLVEAGGPAGGGGTPPPDPESSSTPHPDAASAGAEPGNTGPLGASTVIAIFNNLFWILKIILIYLIKQEPPTSSGSVRNQRGPRALPVGCSAARTGSGELCVAMLQADLSPSRLLGRDPLPHQMPSSARADVLSM